MDDNLSANIIFMLDVIINDENDEPDIETINAALILSHFAWNNEIREDSVKPKYYKKELKKLEKVNMHFWEQLTRNDAEELIDILKKRKRMFYPEDNRLIKSCYINIIMGITVEEDNKEKTIHVEKYF